MSDAGLRLLASIEALMRNMVAQQKEMLERLPPLTGRQRAARAREKRKATEDRNAPRASQVTHPPEEIVTQPVRDAAPTATPLPLSPSPSPSAPSSPSPFIPLPSENTLRPGSEKPDPEPPTRETWAAYSPAYFRRYGAQPVRNRTVNGQMANFVSRIGRVEAPLVAAFYLTHNAARYVGNSHSVGMLLRDAEPLRTQWATNRKVTSTAAVQQDRTQENLESWGEHMSEEGRRALVSK